MRKTGGSKKSVLLISVSLCVLVLALYGCGDKLSGTDLDKGIATAKQIWETSHVNNRFTFTSYREDISREVKLHKNEKSFLLGLYSACWKRMDGDFVDYYYHAHEEMEKYVSRGKELDIMHGLASRQEEKTEKDIESLLFFHKYLYKEIRKLSAELHLGEKKICEILNLGKDDYWCRLDLQKWDRRYAAGVVSP